MSRKKTRKEYVDELKVINPNIELIGEYTTTHTKVMHKCLIDGYEREATPHNILQGTGCPMCAGKTPITHKQYVCMVKEINPNIEVLGIYINKKTKIKHHCLICDNYWDTTPQSVLNGHGCAVCRNISNHKHFSKTQEQYVKEVFDINPNIEVVGIYFNAREPILHRCKIDGYEWMASPDSIIHGSGCPVCSGVKKKTHQEYINELTNINSDIEVIGEYINAYTPILHKCLIDGCEWYIDPHSVLQGRGCPVCNYSRGERRIKAYLDINKIKFNPQYVFEDCKYIKVLPFDFYLQDYNACIEYDGIQHFKPVEHFGGQQALEDTQKRDAIKTNYCKANNIPLLHIRYDEDISSALDNFLDSLTIQNYNQEPERAC